MRKKFNTTGLCLPQKHYMADISDQVCQIAAYVKEGSYFSINCARQYGKTTMLYALARYLHEEYLVISLDFQALGHASFQNENVFSMTFAQYFLRELQLSAYEQPSRFKERIQRLQAALQAKESGFVLFHLFEYIASLCQTAPKPIVLMIDEADSASDNQVFLDFLAQLRYYYLEREKGKMAAFHSVILTGVYDIRSLKMKIRSESEHKLNSPWNIAADFKVDLSLSVQGIEKMLEDYENDCHTGMDIPAAAKMIYDYTCGYPFLVSRICKLLDEDMQESSTGQANNQAWTKEGILSAIRKLLAERNTLFESLTEKLDHYPELERILHMLLFEGKTVPFNEDSKVITLASMFGLVKNRESNVAIANRIFETRLYNRFLSVEELQESAIYKASLWDKNQFLTGGYLDMRKVLERV